MEENDYIIEKDMARWLIVGSTRPTIADEERLKRLILAHGLEMTTKKRLLSEPFRLSNNFYEWLDNRCTGIVDENKKVMDVLLRINNEYHLNGYQNIPILLKGVSTYLYSSHCKELLRHRHDVDILVDDIEIALRVLRKLGAEILDIPCSPHEDAVVVLDDITIEVHNSFPIIKLPDIQINISDEKRRLETTYICYCEVNKNAKEIERIKVPSAAMIVFISCNHMFRDFFWEPYKLPNIKLCDLMGIREIKSNPDYKHDELEQFVYKYDTQYAMEMISEAYEDIFHGDHFYFAGNTSTPKVFKLMNDSFGYYLMMDKEKYYQDAAFWSFNAIVNMLNPNVIDFDVEYEADSLYVYFCSELVNKKRNTFSIEACYSDQYVRGKIRIPGRPTHGDNVFLKVDRNFAHLHFDIENERIIERVYGLMRGAKYEVSKNDSDTIVCFTFPIEFEEQRTNYSSVFAVEQNYMDKKYQTVIPVAFPPMCPCPG